MRINTAQSIVTANAVYERFGSWRAAKEAARFEGGKFVVPRASKGAAAVNGAKIKGEKV